MLVYSKVLHEAEQPISLMYIHPPDFGDRVHREPLTYGSTS